MLQDDAVAAYLAKQEKVDRHEVDVLKSFLRDLFGVEDPHIIGERTGGRTALVDNIAFYVELGDFREDDCLYASYRKKTILVAKRTYAGEYMGEHSHSYTTLKQEALENLGRIIANS